MWWRRRCAKISAARCTSRAGSICADIGIYSLIAIASCRSHR
jgi:hypothetical protein